MSAATLHPGPAAAVLRTLPRASVDMVYADPPFGNQQDWTGKTGSFTDKWSDSDASREGWTAFCRHVPHGHLFRDALSVSPTHRGYLGVMAGIIVGCHRVLRFDGSLWLHFDDTMGGYLRNLCCAIFGPRRELGTIVWKRASSHNDKRGFGRVHDTIAVYGRTRATRRKHARIGRVPPSCIDNVTLGRSAKERVGYPTQKPVALLKMFVEAATWPGETVLDPTCGSGTTLVAATELGRRAIGIDLSSDAIRTAELRLKPKPEPERKVRAVRRPVTPLGPDLFAGDTVRRPAPLALEREGSK